MTFNCVAPLDDYLSETPMINFSHQSIKKLSSTLHNNNPDDISRIKACFEYVRDHISHSFDIQATQVTCIASEVLEAKHGICYAKSHLLTALLRGMSIPAGICYQKQQFLGKSTEPKMCLHALNAAYIGSLERWVRFDARGNKPGVNAQFSLETEQLAFPLDLSLGEEDYMEIYAEPLPCILNVLQEQKTCELLRANLPQER